MTTPEQPSDPVPPPSEAAPPPVAPTPARPEGARPEAARPFRPRRERPPVRPGPMPSLVPEKDFGGNRPRLRDLDAEIEKELNEAMAGVSSQDLLVPPARETDATPGRKKARVLKVHGPDVFLEVPGGRSEGVLPLLQFPDGPPAVGTEVEVSIEGYDRTNGLLILSRKGAAVEADWDSVAAGMVVEARVTATNKGGLEVNVNGIRGFMPISQVDLYRVEDAEQFVNQRMLCMVVEVNPDERNLVLSRRALLEKEREENREKLWNELAEGQVRTGIVRKVLDFGAFVDLGGADGLIPISEMSWQRVNDPTTLVQPGQTVKVAVLRLDREQRKVSLTMKQLTPSPWDDIDTKYPPGVAARGKVSRLAEFGAFVELEPAIEGLVHISELASGRVRRVSDVVTVGQDVQVMVLQIDHERRRIALSLKAALPPEPEEEEVEEEEAVEAKPPRPRTTPLRGGLGGQSSSGV